MKYIHNIVERKMKSSYEDFTLNVMHPLESSAQSTSASTTNIFRLSPQKPPTVQSDALPVPRSSPHPHRSSPDLKSNRSPKVTSLLRLPREHPGGASPPTFRRPRANTNEERMAQTHPRKLPVFEIQSLVVLVSLLFFPDLAGSLSRIRSVPEKLGDLEQTHRENISSSRSSPRKGLSPALSRASPKWSAIFRSSSPTPPVAIPRTSHSHTLPESN